MRVVPAEFGVAEFTVPAVLDRRAEQFGDRVMMSVAGEPVTFEQMRARSGAAANALLDLGIGPGDGVALFAGTRPEWIYFWLGAARIGAVSAAVNTANKGDSLTHALNLAWAKVVITDAERLPRVRQIRDRLDSRTGVVPCETVDFDVSRPPPGGPADAAAVGALFFTSGTTGASKAVATSWHYLFCAAAAVARAWRFAPGETVWTAMPLFHLSAAPMVLAPMLVGGTTVLAAEFHPTEVFDDVRACGAVGFVGVGAMVSMLTGLPARPEDRELPLRFISTAPIDAAGYRAVEDRYGCRVVTMYGQTEAFPITVAGVADDPVPGTSGRPTPQFDVRVVDAVGDPLPAGQVGEIVCRATAPHVMSEGYVAEHGGIVAHPEWFHTGDLGTLDEAGNLTFTDRLKDCLRRRGEHISSIEVEAVVLGHPGVAEAAVVGVRSDLGEDDVLLAVTMRPGTRVDLVELLDFCAERMPYFWVPRYVDVVEQLPKNILGRVRKDLLRARGVGPGAWDSERHGYVVSR